MIEANGVELCTESFGDPGDPPVLLPMGMGGSMLWCEHGSRRLIADGGRFVIRYPVIHGDADPMFPIEHGERLARELPHARLLALEGAGHGLDRADWATVAWAIGAHTGIEGRGQ
jgi:hypothetical protein